MNQSQADTGRCVVVDAAKLPVEVGGPQSICDAVNAAVEGLEPGAVHRIEVRVLSASSLAAVVTLAGGRVLPEQKMAVNDRQLNPGSIERFAAAVAAEVAKANRH